MGLQYSNYLSQIEVLIRKNPSITVREIAAELRFADSKSVYYWLEKSNFRGINEFRRHVLRTPKNEPIPYTVQMAGQTRYLIALPLFNWKLQEKDPMGQWYYLHDSPQPRGLFALKVDTNRFSPWFVADDVIIVNEVRSDLETWVLGHTSTEYLIGRQIGDQMVDPQSLQSLSSGFIVLGSILNQNRYFSS